jgi:hypothetical protein
MSHQLCTNEIKGMEVLLYISLYSVTYENESLALNNDQA